MNYLLVISRSELVVIGGTAEKGVYDLKPNEDEFKGIIERCSQLVPSIKVRLTFYFNNQTNFKNELLYSQTAEIVSKHTGLRPGRSDGIRLEMEYFRRKDSVTKVSQGPCVLSRLSLLDSFVLFSKIVHNYGHGGSGVTLAWGCASDVLEIIENDLKLKSKL